MRLRFAALLLGFASPAVAETFAITDATVHTMTADEPAADTTIIIKDGRIAAVGRDVKVPPGAKVIEARGRIVTPGLMTSNSVLGLTEIASAEASVDHALESGLLGAAFDVAAAINSDSSLIPEARAHGLTRAISAPTASAMAPFQGVGVALHLTDGNVLDRTGIAMFVRVGGRSGARAGGSRAAPWILLRQALDEARASRAGSPRADDPHPPLLGRADLKALMPVVERRMPLAIAAARASDIREAIRLSQDFGIRVIIMGGEEAWRLGPELARHAIPVVLDPTSDEMDGFDTIGSQAENASRLQRAGVVIAFAANPGHRGTFDGGVMLREASGYAVAAGLPWKDALRAVTVNPARIWGLADHYGTIAPGQDADLVVWDGDPFEVTTVPLNVFVKGTPVTAPTRTQMLAKRYAPQR